MSTDPNEIAEGHNPERLTNAQVGVPEWRLLTEEEIREAGSANVHFVQGIQVFDDPRWIFDAVGFMGNKFDATYRTNLSRAELRKARGLEPKPESEVTECHPAKYPGQATCNAGPKSDPSGPATRCQHGFFGQCDKCDREDSERTSHILRSLSEISEIAGDCRGRVLGLDKALDEERADHEKTRQEVRAMEIAVKSANENSSGRGLAQLEIASVKQGAAQLAEDLAQCVREKHDLSDKVQDESHLKVANWKEKEIWRAHALDIDKASKERISSLYSEIEKLKAATEIDIDAASAAQDRSQVIAMEKEIGTLQEDLEQCKRERDEARGVPTDADAQFCVTVRDEQCSTRISCGAGKTFQVVRSALLRAINALCGEIDREEECPRFNGSIAAKFAVDQLTKQLGRCSDRHAIAIAERDDLKRQLETAVAERDDAIKHGCEADEILGYKAQECEDLKRKLMERDAEVVAQRERADNLLDTLETITKKIGYTEEIAKRSEAATGSKLVSDGVKWLFDSQLLESDAACERMRQALVQLFDRVVDRGEDIHEDDHCAEDETCTCKLPNLLNAVLSPDQAPEGALIALAERALKEGYRIAEGGSPKANEATLEASWQASETFKSLQPKGAE